MKKIFVIILLFLFSGSEAQAQSKEQVYAGIILHIMKYVEWPTYGPEMTVGIVNDPLLTKVLQNVCAGKKIHFKMVDIQKLEDLTAPRTEDVIFFPKKALETLNTDIVDQAIKKGILVITEQKDDPNVSSAINFVEIGGDLQIELYETYIDRCGLKVSEQLKRLAVIK